MKRYLSLWASVLTAAALIALIAPGPAGLVFGASALALTALFHSVAGETAILRRLLQRDDLPRLVGSRVFMRRSLRYAWHITSLAWIGLAAIVVAAATGDAGPEVYLTIVAVTLACTAGLALWLTRGAHLSWVVAAAAAGAVWWAR